MKTRRERRTDQWRVCGAFIFMLIAFVAMLTGCATVPTIPRAVQDAERCLKTGPCVVLQVMNSSHLDATIYVNGARFELLNGDATKFTPLFIPRSRLDGSGCIQVVVQLIPIGGGSSSKECIRDGQHFTLEIDGGGFTPLHVWLNPMVNQ